MNDVNHFYQYHAFQCMIQSELFFPELPIMSFPSERIDVSIQWKNVSAYGLDSPLVKNVFFQAKLHHLWLNVPQVGRFLIKHGKSIDIEAAPMADLASIRLFILGSCMGALLMQRDMLLLHGNALQVGDHCVSFVGHSGAGKSTLSGAFLKRGYRILADDICAIDHQLNVLPSFPQIKLWHDSADKLNIHMASLRRIRPQDNKFAVPLAAQFCDDKLPLKCIYVLTPHDDNDIQFLSVDGIQKFTPLQQHTYRYAYLKGLEKQRHCMMRYADLARHIHVVEVRRPRARFALEDLVLCIEDDLVTRVVA
jgi:hypothetical protein